MNTPTQNRFSSGADAGDAEETLRLIAHLPVPEGLEDRVLAGLRSRPRSARILAWPTAISFDSNWMRSAAAAAIVFVVAGGGWGIYSRVQAPQPASAGVQQPHVSSPGGFSSAGAMRTPQTLNGPVVVHPMTALPGHPKVRAPQKLNLRVPSAAANTPRHAGKPY